MNPSSQPSHANTAPSIRGDFPILERQVRGKPLVYLDNAATTQKPKAVLQAIAHYYENSNANVHRAAHFIAEEATVAMEQTRDLLQGYIGAARREEIVFTRGTTESINLLAATLQAMVGPSDEILISELEHHSNIVPWQMLAQRAGATLKAISVTAEGELDMADFANKLTPQTKIVAVNHVSNALGTVNPVEQIIATAQQAGALTIIDGAQAMLHEQVDVQALGCDFYAGSGHKMFGPTGIGFLYGKYDLLCELPPWHGGGEMIELVTLEHSTYQKPPYKFEAGTPHIAGIVGLGAAIEYLNNLPTQQLNAYEDELVAKTISQLQQIPEVKLVGTPAKRRSVVSFLVEGGHPQDIGTLLDQQGVAVRTGHHCAMPLMQKMDIPGTIRASFSLYNNEQDVEQFIAALNKTIEFL